MIVETLLSNSLATAAYFLLMSAIASLWITRNHSVWTSLLTGAFVTALISNRVTGVGIVGVLVFGFICFAFFRLKLNSQLKTTLGFLLGVLAILLGTHKFPGFKNWLVLPNFTLSADSVPIQLYFNFDKPIIGLFLMGFGIVPIRTVREWKSLFKSTLPIILSASSTLLGLALAPGYVKIDLKWFEFSWVWLLVNLLFTCVAEEALFRGFLQSQLAKGLRSWKFGLQVSWIITSILFGLVHLPGGWSYAFLATVAGLFYGYAFIKTHKIEASILVHFSVNAIHFLAFTYPTLRVIK